MITIMTAMALAAAAQPTSAASAPNPPAQAGAMDHSQMDHPKMDHSKMGKQGEGCCKKGADGKMECTMPSKAGAPSDHRGHGGH